MKVRFFTTMLLACIISISNAQNTQVSNVPSVTTKGYAEIEVTPDIVYLSVSLKEFYQDGDLKKKIVIEDLERQLYESAMRIGVKKEDFTIQNIYSYNYNVDKKRKKEDIMQARQYRIRVTNLNGLNDLFDGVDPKGIESTSINSYEHSNKKEIEKELKVKAVHDAMESAKILASASGNTIGRALAISDNSNFNFNNVMPGMQMSFAKLADAAAESAPLDINVRPIKLSCMVDAAFELLK